MTNLFQQLKSKHQKNLLTNAEKYNSVNHLITKFESSYHWSSITIAEFNSFCTWANINILECSLFDVKYGDQFLKKTKKQFVCYTSQMTRQEGNRDDKFCGCFQRPILAATRSGQGRKTGFATRATDGYEVRILTSYKRA